MVACLEIAAAGKVFVGWAVPAVKAGGCKIESCFSNLVLTKSWSNGRGATEVDCDELNQSSTCYSGQE